jgi:hypothetical protein
MKKTLFTLALVFTLALSAFGQAALTSTTLSSAVTTITGQYVRVASASGITANQTAIYVDSEYMLVIGVSGTTLQVVRGLGGAAATHASGATVYYGAPNTSFVGVDPSGSCTSTNYPVLPVINSKNGRLWNCINSTWMVDNGVYELPATACYASPSGNSTGTNGFTVAGASLTPVVQNQTSNTGTNTHNYICNITIPSFLAGKGAAIKDVVFKYGVQTTALGTQAVVLASGTLNSVIVFSYIDYPAAGASETASTVTPVRADSGTLLLTPVAASFNTATTTAGAFYTEKFTPAAAIPVPKGGVDRRQLLFSVALLNTATSATITNSPGLTVHYAFVPTADPIN